jgi:hypothetical protein
VSAWAQTALAWVPSHDDFVYHLRGAEGRALEGELGGGVARLSDRQLARLSATHFRLNAWLAIAFLTLLSMVGPERGRRKGTKTWEHVCWDGRF